MATQELNKEGLLKNSPDSIFLYGGGFMRPLDPDPEDIQIEAIAHALSNQCRWTGHVSEFLSVAEHSVLCSYIEPTLDCLLHDASEAYLSDLARPIKHAPGLGEVYRECETRLEQVIAERFGLAPPPMSDAVKAADNAMLFREAEQLLPELGEMMPDPPEGTPYCQNWSPKMAKQMFLERFIDLGGVVD